MVRAEIARGRPVLKAQVKSAPISIGKTFTNSVTSVGKFLDDLDTHVTKATAIEKAIGPSKQTYETEKMVINSAVEMAKKNVHLEAQLSANPNLRKHFDTAHAELEELIQSTRKQNGAQRPEVETKITISPITMPASHQDPDIDNAIVELPPKDRTCSGLRLRADELAR